MPIALPNLDDRRWLDLVEEGRALIPFYSTEWTDHNVHDPGITLIELFAWLAEMDIFQLDRIPERNLRTFLSLVGIRPNPPVPSLAVMGLSFKNALASTPPLRIPPSVQFDGTDPFEQNTRFRTLSEVFVVPARLKAMQVKDQRGFHDLTSRAERGEEIEIYGADPAPGAELYLGFTCSFPVGVPTTLVFSTNDLHEGEELRRKIAGEQQANEERCRSLVGPAGCGPGATNRTPPDTNEKRLLDHHSVRLVWEALAGPDSWQLLSPESEPSQLVDETRSLTLNGRIILTLTAPLAQQQIGEVKESLHYVRCRFASGSYDAPPVLRSLVVNGVIIEQAVPVGGLRLKIAASANVTGPLPTVGAFARFCLKLNPQGEIAELSFVDNPTVPEFRVLAYSPNTFSSPGAFAFEAAAIGKGDGLPNLRLKLSDAPALEAGFRLFTLENGWWREWTLMQTFNTSGRADFHFTVDLMAGVVRFGDGERGRVPPEEAPIVVRYDATRAAAGNLAANRIRVVADSAHNLALLGSRALAELKSQLTITNLPALGGAAAETVGHAVGRAIEAVETTPRAVTLADHEALALQTPGTKIARAAARANHLSGLPCVTAAGVVTVIVLPYLPEDRPFPSGALRRLVANYLFHRRVIGTRVEVIGPGYVELTVRAQVKALEGTNKPELQREIVAALHRFFHPLTGGPNGSGWPFGRDVFRSEVLQVIDETPRVDHVISLELSANCGAGQCGNLCLSANELIASGAHEIQIV